MHATKLLLALILLAGAAQAGLVQDPVFDICENVMGTGPAERVCSLQNDAGGHQDASDTCTGASTAVSAASGSSFEGILFPFEDRSDWYDADIPTSGNIGVRLVPNPLASPVLPPLRLEVLETDCSTDAVGGGTTGSGSRVSDLEYRITDASAGQDIRIGVVSQGYEETVVIAIPADCHPWCLAPIMDDTVYELVEYVVEFFSF